MPPVKSILAPDRSSRRPALFFVVVLIHVGVVTTLTESTRTRTSRKASGSIEPILAFFIDSTVQRRPVRAETAPMSQAVSRADIERASAPLPIPEINLPPEGRPITSSDWSADITATARDAIARQAARDSAPRIGAHPEGMKPPKRTVHTPGETQDVGEGEVLTWVNDHCFYSNRVKPRSNGFGGVKPMCVEHYQSLEDWLKSHRTLAYERDDE